MQKKKTKQKRPRHRHPSAKPVDAAPAPSTEWSSVEVEFFAREAELYRVSPIDSFDDLEND
jgi:hypothetical protein